LFLEPREATEEEILMKHSVEQIEILKATSECQDEEFLEELSSRYDAIYIHPVSRKVLEAKRSIWEPPKLTITIIASSAAFTTTFFFFL
jgi:hypothetical protein